MEESYLCRRCQSVDWDIAFAPIPPGQWTRTVLKFRSTLEVRPDSRCRLCLAIASLFGLEDVEPTDELDQRLSLVAARSSTLLKKFKGYVETVEMPLMIMGQCPTWLIGMESAPAGPIIRFPEPRVIVENRALEPDEYGVELGIPRRTVDFDHLRRWLKHDVNERGPDPEHPVYPLDLPGMRAIDCELREIVPLTCVYPKYATLSYVWGQSEVLCSTDGKLPDRLPLTIEDSITVCQELGVRYLWVDRYCIQESYKHALIRSMHRIYRESHITIVAAAGCGPESGLPGVGNTPRKATTAVDHPISVGLRQLSYINDIKSHLNRSAQQTADSRWAKRGWTLQEGILSKRICIFLDDQVHLENNTEAQSERVRPCERTQLGPKLTYMNPNDYWKTVSAFCSRDLSYPEDALNAMSGILSTWTQNTTTFRHISGLAVEFNSNRRQLLQDSLLTSLVWRVSGPVPRRRGFPSWSWTGWLNPEVRYMENENMGIVVVLDSVETGDRDIIIHHTQLLDLLRVQHELLDSIKILHITAGVIDICIGPHQNLHGNRNPDSEWRAMLVSDGRERVYKCEVTKLVTKDDMCLLTSRQYIQCKGLVIGRLQKRRKRRRGRSDGISYEPEILIMLWNEGGGYYERFGILRIPSNPSLETKVETIRLG